MGSDELRDSEKRILLDTDNGSSTTVAHGDASAIVGNAPKRFKARAHDEQNLCTVCGHSLGAEECCKTTERGSQRKGERQRQEAGRRRREQARLQEAASLRPRQIPNSDEAVTPAQKILARLKQRVVGGSNPY